MNGLFELRVPHHQSILDLAGDPIALTLTYQQVERLAQEACSTILLDNNDNKVEASFKNLRTLVEEELLECQHAFTEEVEVDDSRWFDSNGNLVEKSNPNQIRCLVCGKIYNTRTEEWVDAE